MPDKMHAQIVTALKHLCTVLNGYGIKPQIINADNELFSSDKMNEFLNLCGILHKPSPAYQQSLNRASEHLGGVIKDKSQAMRLAARLPVELWPEVNQAAVYLHNWMLRYAFNWKSLYNHFYMYTSQKDGAQVLD